MVDRRRGKDWQAGLGPIDQNGILTGNDLWIAQPGPNSTQGWEARAAEPARQPMLPYAVGNSGDGARSAFHGLAAKCSMSGWRIFAQLLSRSGVTAL